MALNNDSSDGIIVDQRTRGRQRASCAPKGVVPESIEWTVEQYEPLFEAVEQDLGWTDADKTEVNNAAILTFKRGRSWRSTTIRTHSITYEDYMRAMQEVGVVGHVRHFARSASASGGSGGKSQHEKYTTR